MVFVSIVTVATCIACSCTLLCRKAQVPVPLRPLPCPIDGAIPSRQSRNGAERAVRAGPVCVPGFPRVAPLCALVIPEKVPYRAARRDWCTAV